MSKKKKESPFIREVRGALRVRHMAWGTEKSYVHWIRRFIMYQNYQSRDEMKVDDIGPFVTMLAVKENLSPTSQNQALSALIFMFKRVLKVEVPHQDITWARKKKVLKVVCSQGEIASILRHLQGEKRLVVQLLYGCGMRLMEALRLRVKDLDFSQGKVAVWDAKSTGNRYVTLPKDLHEPLQAHLVGVKLQHDDDLLQGFGSVELPYSLARKYKNAAWEWKWQYVFPAYRISECPRTGAKRRHHLYQTGIQKAVRRAARKAEIHKRVTPHTFRHCFATHLLMAGVPLPVVSKALGHKDVRTTMDHYCHLVDFDAPSPLEGVLELEKMLPVDVYKRTECAQ